MLANLTTDIYASLGYNRLNMVGDSSSVRQEWRRISINEWGRYLLTIQSFIGPQTVHTESETCQENICQDASSINTLRPRQHGRHFPDNIFKCIFLNENVWTSIQISLKFVPKGPIDNIPALVQIMAWCRPGNKPLSEPMLIILLTHICVDRPQWVNSLRLG